MRDYLVCKSYVAVTAAPLFSHLLLLHLHEHIIIGIRLLPLHHPVMVAGVTSIWSQRCCCYDATTNAPVAAHWSVKRPPPLPTRTPPAPSIRVFWIFIFMPADCVPSSRRRPRKPCDRLVNAGSCEVRGKTCAKKKPMLCLDR